MIYFKIYAAATGMIFNGKLFPWITECLNLANHDPYLETFIDINLIYRIGAMNLMQIEDGPFFYKRLSYDDPEPGEDIRDIINKRIQSELGVLDKFLLGLWLVKDNGVGFGDLFFIHSIHFSKEDLPKSSFNLKGEYYVDDIQNVFENLYKFKPSEPAQVHVLLSKAPNMPTNASVTESETEFSEAELEYAVKLVDHLYSVLPKRKPRPDAIVPKKKIADHAKRYFTPIPSGSLIMHDDMTRLERALLPLDTARKTAVLISKIASYMTVLECLFVRRGDSLGVTKQVCMRVAGYLSDNPTTREQIFIQMDKLYDIRSSFIHGRDSGILLRADYESYSEQADNIVRRVMKDVIVKDWEIFIDESKIDPFFATLSFVTPKITRTP